MEYHSDKGVCQLCRVIFQSVLGAVYQGQLEQTGWGQNRQHYKTLEELETSAQEGCALCNMFWQVVSKDKPDDIPKGTGSGLISHRAGKQGLWISFILEEMDTKTCPVEKSILRFCYTGPWDSLSSRYFQIDLDGDWSTSFPGRPLASSAPLHLVKDWLEMCRRCHGDCHKPREEELPTRLIEIRTIEGKMHLRLIEGPTPARGQYIALSHCWGKPDPDPVTTLENISSHRETIDIESLPANFRDAVHVSKELGYRYLWIDSLCIIQDSADDWQKEYMRMEKVYANATLTLAAIGALNSYAGFLHKRPEQKACLITLKDIASNNVVLRISRLSNGQSCTFPQTQAVLNSRAWALQERLLSKRILSIGREQMYLECCTSRFYECSHYPLSARAESRDQWIVAPELLARKKVKLPTVDDFYSVVGPYAYRYLTKGKDKLPALSGIARRFQALTSDEYIAGIWKSDILSGLLWSSNWHDHGATSEDHEVPRYRNELEAPGGPPSWSWASCNLPVRYVHRWTDNPLVDITSCRATLASEDPFGPISSGELIISGWSAPCTRIVSTQLEGRHWGEALEYDLMGLQKLRIGRVFWDRPDEKLSKVVCVPLSKYKPYGSTGFDWVGLTLTEVDEHTFRRVGLVVSSQHYRKSRYDKIDIEPEQFLSVMGFLGKKQIKIV